MKSFPPFRLDPVNQCLWRGDTRIPLMPKPFAVLTYLVEHSERLVTHDELVAAIWPDTYVQPEVLRRYILEIRRVLGDSAEAPRYIQTFPKRGYQFIAPVEDASAAAPGEAPATPATPARARRPRTMVAGLLGAAAMIAAGIAGLFAKRTEALRDRDSIILGGFENRSGDAVFDLTLRQGLAAHLSQSPFLNIVPEERVRETLRLMERPPDDRLSHELALEVCRRQGVKAMLEGSIATLGRVYVLGLDATNCKTGESIAREQEEVERKEDVLRGVGRMASHLRGTLGESLASIQRFDAPIEQIT